MGRFSLSDVDLDRWETREAAEDRCDAKQAAGNLARAIDETVGTYVYGAAYRMLFYPVPYGDTNMCQACGLWGGHYGYGEGASIQIVCGTCVTKIERLIS